MDEQTLDRYPHEEVDKSICPRPRGKGGRFKNLFDPLPLNKAIRFICPTRSEACKLGANISASLRSSREGTYKTHYRSVPEGNHISLYVWKEMIIKENR